MRNFDTIINELYEDPNFQNNAGLLTEFNTEILRIFDRTVSTLSNQYSNGMIPAEVLSPALSDAIFQEIIKLTSDKRTWLFNLALSLVEAEYLKMESIRNEYNKKGIEIPDEISAKINKTIQALGILSNVIERFPSIVETMISDMYTSAEQLTTTFINHLVKSASLSDAKIDAPLKSISESPITSQIETSPKFQIATKIRQPLQADMKSTPKKQITNCYTAFNSLSDDEKTQLGKRKNENLIKGLIIFSWLIIPAIILAGISIKARYFSSKKTANPLASHGEVYLRNMSQLFNQHQRLLQALDDAPTALPPAIPSQS